MSSTTKLTWVGWMDWVDRSGCETHLFQQVNYILICIIILYIKYVSD